MIKSIKYSILIVGSFLSIYLIWGTTYLAILIGLESFPPFMLTSFRFAIAGILLMTYCIIRRLPQPTKKTLFLNGLLGLTVLIGGQGLLIWAEQYISSGYAAVIVSSAPIWYVLLDTPNRPSYFSNKAILLGVIIGFIGIVFLFYDQLNQFKASILMTIIGSIVVVISVLCWVGGTLYHQSILKSGGIFINLSWQLLFAAIIGGVISLVLGEGVNFSLQNVSFESWGALLFLAIAGSVVAFVAYTWLLTQKRAVLVGTYAYINPIIAVFLGWLVAGESISYLQVVAILIIIFSAFIINVNKP